MSTLNSRFIPSLTVLFSLKSIRGGAHRHRKCEAPLPETLHIPNTVALIPIERVFRLSRSIFGISRNYSVLSRVISGTLQHTITTRPGAHFAHE